MTTVSFDFQGKAFSLAKEEDYWQMVLQKSEVSGASLAELSLLNVASPYLLSLEVTVVEDLVTFNYRLPRTGVTFADLQERPLSEQLRFGLNTLGLRELLDYELGLVLDPENLFLTANLEPKLAYRSLFGIMVPERMDEADFIRQFKCLLVTVMVKETSFAKLYEGSLEVIKLSPFLQGLVALDSLEELEAYVTEHYEAQFAREAETLSLVDTRRFKLFRYASIWLSAALVLLLIPLVYLIFLRNPFKDKMLEADSAFLKVDYTAVINKLESVSLRKLPYTQKYELAYSYIQGQSLSKEQRRQVLNNVTLKSEELYLDYWILIGRGQAEEALDVAKRLDDVDLKIYAVVEALEVVKADDKLSGKDRDAKLSELEGTYKTLSEERNSYLDTDKSGEASDEGSSSESTREAASSASEGGGS